MAQTPLREQLTAGTGILGLGGYVAAIPILMFNFLVGVVILVFATVFIVVALRVDDFSMKLGDYFQMKSRNRPSDW